MSSIPSHSASNSMEGYVYQCQYALLESLKRLNEELIVSVSIETLDDVVFHENDKVTSVTQTKLHSTSRKLTNSSADFWKTVQIWIDIRNDESISDDTLFFLVTTEIARQDTIPYFLRPQTRNTDSAIMEMDKWVDAQLRKEEKSVSNIQAYNSYNQLNKSDKKMLFENCFVLDDSANYNEISDEISKALGHVCSKDLKDKFISDLFGWWIRRILLQFKDRSPIKGTEIEDKIDGLREMYKRDNLPISDEIMETRIEFEDYWDYEFIKQIELIKLGQSTKEYAIQDYYQALEQRNKWLREGFIFPGDMQKYDQTLTGEWKRYHDLESVDLNFNSEKDMVSFGQKIYKNFQNQEIPIRKNFLGFFLTRGTYHILANQMKIGWHPQYKTRIATRKRKRQNV